MFFVEAAQQSGRGFDQVGDLVQQGRVVGDSTTSDMPAAQNAGMDFCWVNPTGAEAPEGYAPRYVVARIDELRPLLGLDA